MTPDEKNRPDCETFRRVRNGGFRAVGRGPGVVRVQTSSVIWPRPDSELVVCRYRRATASWREERRRTSSASAALTSNGRNQTTSRPAVSDGLERKLRRAGASASAASATTYVHDSGSGRRCQQAPLACGGTSSPAAIQPGQFRCALARSTFRPPALSKTARGRFVAAELNAYTPNARVPESRLSPARGAGYQCDVREHPGGFVVAWLKTVDAEGPLEAVLGTDPELFGHLRGVVATFWTERLVDPIVLELCRLRTAALVRCDAELRLRYQPAIDAGLDEDKIGQLPRYYNSDRFTEFERACLAFTEQFVIDAHGIDDKTFERVSSALSPEAMAMFVSALAYFEGIARMKLMLGIEPPEEITIAPCPAPARGTLY
jgi:alkylhydroperoxidase family enzyme